MPKIRRSRKKPPDGWELIEPTLEELEQKMREGTYNYNYSFLVTKTYNIRLLFSCFIYTKNANDFTLKFQSYSRNRST